MPQNSDLRNITFNGNITEENMGFSRTVQERYVYGSVMFFILTVGFVGNAFTIIVFLRKQRRSQIISPYIINLAVADLFIIIFGYPVAASANLSAQKLLAGSARCTWSAFVNGSVGIASIATLAEISVVMCYTITKTISPELKKFSTKLQVVSIAGAWLYGIIAMVPPIFGWSRFAPGSAGISCSPDWRSKSGKALSYNIVLMMVGFVLPIAIISKSYYKIYRSLDVNSMLAEQTALLVRRRKSQVKVVRMIAASVFAFVLSWSPYCVVCLIAMIKHEYVMSGGQAEIPELMAKASVIYNPFVYIIMNRDFRKTVKKILNCASSSQQSVYGNLTLQREPYLVGRCFRSIDGKGK